MGGGRNKSKKFLKQKQAKQKKRSPQKVQSVGKGGGKKQGTVVNKPGGLSRDDLSNLSNSDIHFHKSQFDESSEISDNISLISEVTIAADEYLNVDEQQEAFNELDQHFDNLAEKDAIMRQSALERINHALRRRLFDDYLRAKSCDKLQTLSMYLRDSLRRGDTNEQLRALETCALVMVTLQASHDILERSVRPFIMRFIQRPHSIKVQIKSIRVWTCMMWVLNDSPKTLKTIDLLDDIWMKRLSHKRLKTKFKQLHMAKNSNSNDSNDANSANNSDNTTNDNVSDDDELLKETTNKTGSDATYLKDGLETESVSDDEDANANGADGEEAFEEKKEELFESSQQSFLTESQTELLHAHGKKIMPENVAVAALEAWTWLIASIDSSSGIASLLEVYQMDLIDILEHNKSIPLRVAVGGALTLLLSNYKASGGRTHNGKNNEMSEDHNDSGVVPKGRDKIDSDAVLAIFYEFLEESGVKRRNLIKEQKKKFRLYVKSVESLWAPSVKIKLRQQVFELEGWGKWITYHRLASHLVSGFQPHLLENPTVQAAFDMENVEPPQPLNKLEKKSKLMAHADNAKQQKQQIKGQRQKKQAFMFNHSAE